MKKPNINEIRDRNARSFINYVASPDLDKDMKRAELMSYRVGFIGVVDEFAVEELIDALVGMVGEFDTIEDQGYERNRLLEKAKSSLKKAGVEL